MRADLKLLRVILIGLGCLHLCGGHYVALQLVAWSKMLVEYSAERGLIEGFSDTFDGQHPCDLCCAIREAKEKEQKPLVALIERLELKNVVISRPVTVPVLLSRDLESPKLLPPAVLVLLRSDVPELPPPRWS